MAKTDGGLWRVGAVGKTYSWVNTQVSVGTLRMNLANVLPATGTITLGQNDPSNATLDLNGFGQTTAGITYNFAGTAVTSVGSITTGAGTLTLNGNVTYNTVSTYTGAGGNITGNLNLGGGTRTFTIGDSILAANEFTIGANLSNGGLTKAGAGSLTLSGTNTYAGPTTVSAGMLKAAKQVSLYNNTPANWTATNIIVSSGATLALNVGGTGEFTASDVDVLKALGTATGGFLGGSVLGLDTTNAAGGNFTYGTAIANTNGGANAIGLTKLGTNTLTLTASNTYAGTTTIDRGTLALTADQTLAGGLTFATANGSTNVGTLNSSANATFGGNLLVRTNNATANQISIGSGKTLTVNGGLTLGYDAGGGTGATNSNLTVSGLGAFAVTGTTISVSVNQAATNAGYWSQPTLDLTGLGSGSSGFSANVTNFNIGVGGTTQGPGTVLLSNVANTIVATTLTVGDTGGNNGRGTGTLTLGTGTNVLQADTINIGRGKNTGPGLVNFASQAAGSPGTVTVTNKAGTGAANITVANINGVGTGGGPSARSTCGATWPR